MDDEWDTFGGVDEHPGFIDNSSLFNGVYFHLYSPLFACRYMAPTAAAVMNSEQISYFT
jgi:hypothetical protein